MISPIEDNLIMSIFVTGIFLCKSLNLFCQIYEFFPERYKRVSLSYFKLKIIFITSPNPFHLVFGV
jgi:hypothetical protein